MGIGRAGLGGRAERSSGVFLSPKPKTVTPLHLAVRGRGVFAYHNTFPCFTESHPRCTCSLVDRVSPLMHVKLAFPAFFVMLMMTCLWLGCCTLRGHVSGPESDHTCSVDTKSPSCAVCSEILQAAELERWLAETSTGVVLPSASAWFRWLTRSDLIASAWMPRVQGPGSGFWRRKTSRLPRLRGNTWWLLPL